MEYAPENFRKLAAWAVEQAGMKVDRVKPFEIIIRVGVNLIFFSVSNANLLDIDFFRILIIPHYMV